MIAILLRDFRYAARQLRRSYGFTVVAVATLALGVGANTAIFSVVYGLLLQSLPFRDAGRIVSILETHPRITGGVEATFQDYLDWRKQQTSFEQLAAYSVLNPATVSLRLADRSESIHRVLASGNFFSVLGVSPLMGRALEERDDVSGGNRVAVLSETAWRRYFGANPGILGQSIDLDGTSYSVVGVLPPRAEFPAEGDVWLPLAFLDQPTQASRVWHSVRVLGRLRPGVTLAGARSEMETIAGRIAETNPATNRGESVQLNPLRDQLVGSLRPALLCVMGSVALVLLIACANVANLLLVRSSAAQRDGMIRRALGASRARLFSQHLAQTVLICLMGGAFGILFARGTMPLLRIGLSHAPGLDASMIDSIQINIPALIVNLSVCLLTALIFGMLPLLGNAPKLSEGMNSGNRGFTAGHASRQSILIAGEIAIAVVVSFLCFLMIRSFDRLMTVDPGYRTDHLLSFEIILPQPRYQDSSPETDHFIQQFLDRLQTVPGVSAVATTNQVPLDDSKVMTRFLIDGETPLTPGTYPLAQIRSVTPNFFTTAGVGILSGRSFTQDELVKNANVFVVNQTFARRYLGNRNPIGAKILIGVMSPQPTSIPVIGVVADAHDVGIQKDPPAEIFLPGFGLHEVVLIRTAADPHALVPVVRSVLHGLDPGQPIYHIQTLDEVLSESVALQRMTAILLSVFAGVALVLATVGIYGILAFSVVQRTREIGVRMAVGAQRKDILGLFLGRAFRFALAGGLLGLGIALLCARAINGLLFKTSTVDPLSILSTVIVLGAVVVLAVSIPARRAASVNPTEALRSE
ncbi:MAG TPA: ABC transporter permease [Terracidiphilus sp.]|nr:ABC transporter permease [Terracidiphilus sp.]